MKRPTALSCAIFLSAASLLSAENATEIIEKHTTEAATAVAAYLEKNPEAEDMNEALDFLIESYGRLGEEEKMASLLGKKYDAMPKGADLQPQEFFGVFQMLFEQQMNAGNKAAAKELLAQAKKDIVGHPDADRFGGFIDQMGGQLNQPGVGDTMEIAFTSLAGTEVDLAKMKGKVVLIDYWATWCGPCIAELPTVKKAYTEHKDAGFEIIGISLDKADDEKKLRDFVKAQDMTWEHAFDGGGWGASLAKKYGINSIPATFLIGKDGKVAATDLRGEALAEKVAAELAK